eukprot:COSAG01_NODE_2_length_63927_cov_1357.611941_10_plen_220_part_00
MFFFRFFYLFFLTSFLLAIYGAELLNSPPSIALYLKQRYVIDQAPIYYYKKYKKYKKPVYAKYLVSDSDGQFYFILDNEKWVQVLFIQKEALLKHLSKDQSIPRRSTYDDVGQRARLSYQQLLQRSLSGFGSSDFISSPQMDMTEQNNTLPDIQESSNFKDEFYEAIHYRDLTSYTDVNAIDKLLLKRVPKRGRVTVRDDGLYLVSGVKLNVLFQLIKL